MLFTTITMHYRNTSLCLHHYMHAIITIPSSQVYYHYIVKFAHLFQSDVTNICVRTNMYWVKTV